MSPRPDMHTAGTACRRHPNQYHRESNHYNCRSIHYNRQSNHCQTNHSSPYYLPGRRAHRRRARRQRAPRRRSRGCESVRLRSLHGIPGPFPPRTLKNENAASQGVSHPRGFRPESVKWFFVRRGRSEQNKDVLKGLKRFRSPRGQNSPVRSRSFRRLRDTCGARQFNPSKWNN